MKKFQLLNIIICTTLIAIILFSALPVKANELATAPTATGNSSVYLEVSQPTVKSGGQFEVQVKIVSVVPTRGAQFSVSYDPRLIQLAGVKQGDYYADGTMRTGGSTYFIAGATDNKTGHLDAVAVALTGGKKEGITGE